MLQTQGWARRAAEIFLLTERKDVWWLQLLKDRQGLEAAKAEHGDHLFLGGGCRKKVEAQTEQTEKWLGKWSPRK